VVDLPELAGRIEAQIGVAVEEAAALVFLTDAGDASPPRPGDRRPAAPSGKPVVLAVNKVDTQGTSRPPRSSARWASASRCRSARCTSATSASS